MHFRPAARRRGTVPAAADHLAEMQPTCAKALLWCNVEGNAAKNERQVTRALELQSWHRANDRHFMVELLIPAEPAQEAATAGDRVRYETEVLPPSSSLG